jgi:hypothetical protein
MKANHSKGRPRGAHVTRRKKMKRGAVSLTAPSVRDAVLAELAAVMVQAWALRRRAA